MLVWFLSLFSSCNFKTFIVRSNCVPLVRATVLTDLELTIDVPLDSDNPGSRYAKPRFLLTPSKFGKHDFVTLVIGKSTRHSRQKALIKHFCRILNSWTKVSVKVRVVKLKCYCSFSFFFFFLFFFFFFLVFFV